MDLLEGLHHRLLLSISAAGHADPQPMTIGELYQRFIPYRAVRDELHILELAEYEHALLRLLSGEGGYVEVEPEPVRLEIQRELASPNPILGIYRDYSEAAVRLSGAGRTGRGVEPRQQPASGAERRPDAPRGSLSAQAAGAAHSEIATTAGSGETRPAPGRGGSSPHSPTPASIPGASQEGEQVHPADAGPASARSIPPVDVEVGEPLPLIYPPAEEAAAAGRGSVPSHPADPVPHLTPPAPDLTELTRYCGSCSAQLPSIIDARFCPFCGSSQVLRPCGRCGNRCESHWSYCAGCGFGLS